MGLRRRRRRGFAAVERKTIALGVAAYAVTAAALLAEFGRVWRRGSAPLPRETDSVIDALAEAAGEERIVPGSRLLLAAFGAGLTWGSLTMTWGDCDVG